MSSIVHMQGQLGAAWSARVPLQPAVWLCGLTQKNKGEDILYAPSVVHMQGRLGLRVCPSTPLFGFVGRLDEQKGVDILLAALPQVLGPSAMSSLGSNNLGSSSSSNSNLQQPVTPAVPAAQPLQWPPTRVAGHAQQQPE
eukprot:scaffold192842_cov20-Tisochrysis_lutea.AAC.1